MFNKITMTVMLLIAAVCGFTQQEDTIRNYINAGDLYKLNRSFNRLDSTVVSFQIRYSLSDQPSVLVDSVNGNYHLKNGMIRGSMGDVEMLRNANYTLTVNHEDSFIVIGRPDAGAGTFQINFFDSLFKKVNVQGIDIIDAPGGLKAIRVEFKPDSYYKNYVVTYTQDFLIKKIHVEMLDLEEDENGNPPPSGRRKVIDVLYTSYQHNDNYDISNFNEALFVRKNEYGKWVAVQGFQGYEVIESQSGL